MAEVEAGAPRALPLPILGTATFGEQAQVHHITAGVLLRAFCGVGCAKTPRGVLVDAAVEGLRSGSEEAIGEIIEQSPSLARRLGVSTKAYPSAAPHFSLSRQSIVEQCDASLDKLGVDSVDIFYLHEPDSKTDVDDTLAGIAELHKDGKFNEFGLSNYPAWAVADIWHRCKSRGMVLPTVYQGMYNVLTRDLEREIVPVARQLGMRIFVYNPLAGGLLSGRYACLEDVLSATDGRFSSDDPVRSEVYRNRYAKAPILEGVCLLRTACAPETSPTSAPTVEHTTEHVVDGVRVRLEVTETVGPRPDAGVSLTSVALRWLLHHSLLAGGDGVILGVSKESHLTANVSAWREPPLPAALLAACDAAWEAARPACEPCFRGYGSQPVGVEHFSVASA